MIKHLIISIALLFYFSPSSFTQAQADSLDDLERTFMPQFQLGYVLNQTENLSNGLMTQTSIEYRDITNLVFRINYDVFNTSMNLEYPLNDSARFTGKTTFSDLIGGIGYRIPIKKHNLTAYVQSGIRFHGYPLLVSENDAVSIDFDRRFLGVMRYTLGYEYALTPKLYLSLELFTSHVFQKNDFWNDSPWAYGLTFGLTAPLF